MNQFRIRELGRTVKISDTETHFEGRGVYRIDELVTKDGLYITWDELFATKENALEHLKKLGHVSEVGNASI